MLPWFLAATLGGASVYAHYNPEETYMAIQDARQIARNVKDQAVLALDLNQDHCLTAFNKTLACVSVGGYLKSIISETPSPL